MQWAPTSLVAAHPDGSSPGRASSTTGITGMLLRKAAMIHAQQQAHTYPAFLWCCVYINSCSCQQGWPPAPPSLAGTGFACTHPTELPWMAFPSWGQEVGLVLAFPFWPSVKKSPCKSSFQKSCIPLLRYYAVFHSDLKKKPSSHSS